MLRVIEVVHQATLVPELLAKKGAEASVHVSVTESVLDADSGKVYAGGSPQDVHEHDAEVVGAARALLALIAEKRAARVGVAVRAGLSITEPTAG
jgi:hypothetical protein